MPDPIEQHIHLSDEYQLAERRRVDAVNAVAIAVSGSTVRTTPETLIKWAEIVRKYNETGAVK